MKVRPLGSKVLIKRDKAPETTEGGIIIPDTANEKPLEGEVVAVGSGKVLENGKTQKLTVKKGDIVFFGPYSGTEINLEGDEYLIVDEGEIIAIVEQ